MAPMEVCSPSSPPRTGTWSPRRSHKTFTVYDFIQLEIHGPMKRATDQIQRRYLDVASTAVYLCTTIPALYTLVARRQIPFRKRGSCLIFDVFELDEYVHRLDGVDVDEAVARKKSGGTNRRLLN
jgi:hypothetical protein